jgi:hypothetical protein
VLDVEQWSLLLMEGETAATGDKLPQMRSCWNAFERRNVAASCAVEDSADFSGDDQELPLHDTFILFSWCFWSWYGFWKID